MFGRSFTLFRLFGFRVKIDMSWLVIALLVTWSLARGYFPYRYEGLSNAAYWVMGVSGAAGLFASIVFHEFSHSLVARRYGLPMKGITLFIFGGVAEMSEEPRSAKTEFMMAVAGPAASIVLGTVFYFLYVAAGPGPYVPAAAVIRYLAFINWLLAGFNLLPAFPLDGGRMLRSALWRWKGDLRWATRTAARAGSFFGILLITLGVLNVFAGNPVGGVWYFMIGMFLRYAARMSYRQVLTRGALEGEQVGRFMSKDPVTVPPGVTIRELVEDYVYKFHFKMFPVARDGKLLGCISVREVKNIPHEEWNTRTAEEMLSQCSADNTVSPDLDAVEALAKMRRSNQGRLMVVEGDRLLGVITLRDILGFLALKLDLDEEEI
jgi:Zn-dependent protease